MKYYGNTSPEMKPSERKHLRMRILHQNEDTKEDYRLKITDFRSKMSFHGAHDEK